MRQIGTIEGEERARRFSDLLTVEAIGHDLDPDGNGTFTVWVHDEDRLAPARELLDRWRADPTLADSPDLAAKARALRKKEEREREAARKRAEQTRRSRMPMPGGIAPVTLALILASVAVTLLTRFGGNGEVARWFWFSNWVVPRPAPLVERLPEIAAGQIWRLVTPIFVHLTVLHILFNMWWLKDLGSAVERHHGLRVFVPLVLLTAIVPNFAQFWFEGPGFGGMSGVVYGLLGYIWMRGKFDPLSGLHLPQQIVTFMLLWFLVGVFGLFNMANWAHGVGLGVGMAVGFFLAKVFPSYRLR